MNAVATFLRSQHQVTNYKPRSCANSHRNDSCVVYFLYCFSHSKRLGQLSLSPVPQSSPTVQSHSPVPSPVHRIETAEFSCLIISLVNTLCGFCTIQDQRLYRSPFTGFFRSSFAVCVTADL